MHNARVSHADLTVDAWLALSADAAERTAAAIARDVDAELLSVAACSYAGRAGRVALFERDGFRFALVPGGTVHVGHDPDRFVPTRRQLDDFAEAVDLYSVPAPIHRFLAEALSPPRRAETAGAAGRRPVGRRRHAADRRTRRHRRPRLGHGAAGLARSAAAHAGRVGARLRCGSDHAVPMG
ncbi:hypothetical protein GCM10009827_092680 [Dactylosporangium maewongense]|uniref:Uncharacterized protein n=1 Tax=Dactylosporangium maewongense TaxID=634393 RepID=A0ABP4NA79_9ACTN